MIDDRLRKVDHSQAHLQDAIADIDILAIHEEFLIEAAGRLQSLPPNHERRAGNPVDVAHRRMVPVAHQVVGGKSILGKQSTEESVPKEARADEEFFMYCEDVDICYRVLQMGLR